VGVITTAGCINRLLQLDTERSCASVNTFRMDCGIQSVYVPAHSTYMCFVYSFHLIIMYLGSRPKRCVSETYMMTQKCLSAPLCLRHSQWRIATGWTVRGSKPGCGEFFRILSALSWCQPSFKHHYRVIFRGKAVGV
jgi:hypothetical protein